MADYHVKRDALKTAVVAHLTVIAQQEGASNLTQPVLEDALKDQADHVVGGFEDAVLKHHRDTFKRGFIDYWMGVSQGIVSAIIFAIILAVWYFVEFGSRQDPRELAIKAMESHSAHASPTPKVAPTP